MSIQHCTRDPSQQSEMLQVGELKKKKDVGMERKKKIVTVGK